MNTDLKRFGKALGKENLKKMKGGVSTVDALPGIECGSGVASGPCKCCTAHNMYDVAGTSTDKHFCNTNYGLMAAWESAWNSFGYSTTCTQHPWS